MATPTTLPRGRNKFLTEMATVAVQPKVEHPTKDPGRAVQSTNDNSTVSKLSMCEAGYFSDPFLKSFVSKPSRRTALINRGYYIRVKAIHHVLTEFLHYFADHDVQIISLGAGFDTSYFRLSSLGKLDHCKFFEVDFPAVVAQKLNILQTDLKLSKFLEGNLLSGEAFFDSKHYCVLGCDLKCLSKFQQLLEAGHVNYSAPTLFLSECVLTYIQSERVNALLRWSASSFSDALFCTYEQIHPLDGFGNVMQQHFLSLGSPLNNINSYPTRQSQEQRYKDMGWDICQSCDMNTFYAYLFLAERQRVETLELFDEYEEWHLKCSHYMILCSFKGCCSPLARTLLPVKATDPCYCIKASVELHPLSMSDDSVPISRYAHSSVLLRSGGIVAVGGFGCSSASPVHGRLDDVLLLKPYQGSPDWECKPLLTAGKGPGKLMHHSTVLLRDGSLLLCGGRASPVKPSSSFFQLRLEGAMAVWSCINLDPTSDFPEPRWRHTATSIIWSNGIEGVVIIGGCTTSVSACKDCYMLNTSEWKIKKLPVTLPEGRHSHCTLQYGKGVIIAGGLNSAMVPIGSCLHLSWSADGWCLDEIAFNPPLPPRYSAAGCVAGDLIWLLGGVDLNSSSELLMINPLKQSWVAYTVKALLPCPPLFHKHTIHHVNNGLLVIAGGGNHFSFGTHTNSWPLIIDLYT